MVRSALRVVTVAVAVAVWMGGCAKAPPRAEHGMSDKELARALVGTWRMEDTVLGITVSGVSTYRADGTASGQIVVGDEPPVELEWTWRIEDGQNRTRVTKSSSPDLMAVGETGTDRVLRLTESEYVYVDDEGQQITERRLR